MAGLSRGVGPGVLHLMTHVLEGLEWGAGGRQHLCQGVGELLECEAVAHASREIAARSWSVCLWRTGAQGIGPLTLTQPEDPDSVVDDDAWWATSTCRRVTLEWMVTPFLAEVPLTRDPVRSTLLVLGRERPFGLEDVRRADTVLHHLLLLEHLVLRLEPPGPPPPSQSGEPLTEREHEVLVLLSRGLMARSIAARLHISERTVHKHLGNLYRKLGTHDRLMAVERGRSLGLLLEAGNPPAVGEGW